MTVELFFNLAVGAELLPQTNRKSNRVDIAYLFYLPFCHAFVSQDDLHRKCAPLFLRPNQKFLWGADLKAELKRLNEHYSELPEIERMKGIIAFADRPLRDGDFLTTQLYDHFFPGWLDKTPIPKLPPEVEKSIIDRMNAMIKSTDVLPMDMKLDDEEIQNMSIPRRVRGKKGSWYQVPADMVMPPEPGDC